MRRELPRLLKEGKTVPFQEVFAIAPRQTTNNGNRNLKRMKQQIAQLEARIEKLKEADDKKQLATAQKQLAAAKQRKQRFSAQAKRRRSGQAAATAKLLGGDVIKLTEHADAREPLMQWLRDPNNGYFARAFVNRVWANYFNVGIVEPPDDLSLANPPSNKPLLDYLTQGFIDNGYDMKWLHREITSSRTYQLSWQPNETNAKDDLNRELTGKPLATARNTGNQRGAANIARNIANQKRRISQAKKDGNDELVKRLTQQLKRYKSRGQQVQKPRKQKTVEKTIVETKPADKSSLVRQAYLRTLSRYPSEAELSRSISSIDGEENVVDGLRGLMWALINTKEFIVNH